MKKPQPHFTLQGELMVEANALHKSYSIHGSTLHVLKGIDLFIRRGEIVAMKG